MLPGVLSEDKSPRQGEQNAGAHILSLSHFDTLIFFRIIILQQGNFALSGNSAYNKKNVLLSIFVRATQRLKLVVMSLPVSNYGIKNPHTYTPAHAHTQQNKDLNTYFEELRRVVTLGENFLSTLCSCSPHRAETKNL